ncbi:MAG: LysR family transcriptional regulator [Flavobacterium sp.]|nr:LysR family transcriptional regulator [Flavobacterium sp.]
MNYTLHQLKLFVKIVQTKSITKTADALFLTQPAVSIQLKNFQQQFEIPLTEIIGKQLFVTEFGEEIAKIANKILLDLDEIQYTTNTFKGILSGKLKISIVSTGKYIMPFFLKDFLQQYDNVSLELDVTNKQKVIKSLESNEIDFALISVLPNNLKIDTEILLENKLFLMSSQLIDNDNNKKNKSLFNNLPLIYREEGSGTRKVMQNYFDRNQIQTQIKLQLTSNEAVKQAVIAGLGSSIMPLIGCKNELKNHQLHIINVDGFPIASDWRLIYLKDKVLSPVADAYLKFIKINKDKIVEENFSWIKDF